MYRQIMNITSGPTGDVDVTTTEPEQIGELFGMKVYADPFLDDNEGRIYVGGKIAAVIAGLKTD